MRLRLDLAAGFLAVLVALAGCEVSEQLLTTGGIAAAGALLTQAGEGHGGTAPAAPADDTVPGSPPPGLVPPASCPLNGMITRGCDPADVRTICNDGTLSCSTGPGTCSTHDGICVTF